MSLRTNSEHGKRLRTRIRYPATYGGAECSGNSYNVENCSLNATVERLLAESDVIVAIKESVVVDDPNSFQNDLEAVDALRGSVANSLGLRPGAIVIRSVHAGNETQPSGPVALFVEMARASADDTSAEDGSVNVEYDVLCEGQSYEQCYNNATQMNTTELNDNLLQQLTDIGRTYQVQVKELDISEVETGTRKKLKEKTIRSFAQTRCKAYIYCSVFLLLFAVFSDAMTR